MRYPPFGGWRRRPLIGWLGVTMTDFINLRRNARVKRHPGAVAASLIAGGVGVYWLARPDAYPFGTTDRVTVSVTHRIEYAVAGTLLVTSALLGIIFLALGSLRRTANVERLSMIVAVAQTLFFGLVMTDASIMSLLGYAVAFTGPVIVLALVVAACLRRRGAGYLILAALMIVGGTGVATGTIDLRVVSTFWWNVSRSFASFGARIGWTLLMALLAATWAWTAVRLAAWTNVAKSPIFTCPYGIRRWGKVVTLAAALCPLPYAFLRLLWLTPWPVDLRADMDRPEIRMQGAFLGVAALIGCILTLGLISRWGEAFPRWVPFLGSRPVPARLAVVPGSVVAAAATMAGPGLLLSGLESNGAGRGVAGVVLTVFIFPFPIWGPLLGAAVLAYHLRRRIDRRPPSCDSNGSTSSCPTRS